MTEPDLIISTKDLTKTYGRKPVVDKLNLAVQRGSICGFLGPNGAGKSTTIKLLLGLVKPSTGNGTIFGKSIVQDSLAIRERVGFLAQEPHFYGYLSARETLRFVASFAVFIGSIVLGAPAIITYVTAVIFGLPLVSFLLGYFVGVLMIYLLLLFILALTLMLGTFLGNIGMVTAISLFVFIGGASLNSNQQLQRIKPYSFSALQRYAVETVAGRFPPEAWIAMGITLSLTMLCLLVASWQMERYEL